VKVATTRETFIALLFQGANVIIAIVNLELLKHVNEIRVIMLGGSPLDRSLFEKTIHVHKELFCSLKLVDFIPRFDDVSDVSDLSITAVIRHGTPHTTKKCLGLVHHVPLAEHIDNLSHNLAIRLGLAIACSVIIRQHFEKLGRSGVVVALDPRKKARRVFDLVGHSSSITIFGQAFEPREDSLSVFGTVSASRIGPMSMRTRGGNVRPCAFCFEKLEHQFTCLPCFKQQTIRVLVGLGIQQSHFI
jgi:hypothetical protein